MTCSGFYCTRAIIIYNNNNNDYYFKFIYQIFLYNNSIL